MKKNEKKDDCILLYYILQNKINNKKHAGKFLHGV
jgi:hypothetical protein